MTSMMLFSLLFVASAARTEVSPVEKVITLLSDLKSQVQEEGAAEAGTYDKYACFCKDTTNKKVENIETGETSVTTLTADVKALNAEIGELTMNIKDLNTEIDTLETDLKEATAIRAEENAVYEAEFADMSQAVDALHAAIGHIQGSKGAGFAEIKASVQKTMALADALSMPVKNQAVVTAFLASDQMPEVPEEDYSFHSGGIIGTLEEILKEFTERKDTLDKEETAAQASFDAMAKAKREEIDSSKATLESKEDQLSTAQSDLATTEEDLTETTALLNDDNTYLKDITGQCETKAHQWDQRSKQRKDELSAITQALEIIEGTVASKDSATGSGGRALVSVSETADDEKIEKPTEEYSDVVFAQIKKHSDTTSTKLRNKVISLIDAAAKKEKSSALSLFAMKLAADPFAKVKTLIQKLIERLLTEATNEATQKGWCDTELGKAKKDRDFRYADTKSLNAAVAELRARKAKLEATETQLTEEIATLNGDLNTATENRMEEKTTNKQTLADAKEGTAAVEQAIKILTDFYKGAAKAFVQKKASPVGEDMAAAGADAGFSGNSKGNQAAGAGIIGMLETILSDFKRTTSTTEANEHQANRDFVKYSQETKVSLSTKETGLKQTVNELKMCNGDLVASLNDLREQQSLLDISLESLEKLRPACIDTGMSYEERVAKREAEIAALKNALCTLDEEDGEIAECAGKFFFLQKK